MVFSIFPTDQNLEDLLNILHGTTLILQEENWKFAREMKKRLLIMMGIML